MRLGVFDFATGTLADIAAHIDDENFISHINLTLMHVIQHFFGAFGPNFIISAMTKQAHADDDVSFKGKPLLRLNELLLEASTAA